MFVLETQEINVLLKLLSRFLLAKHSYQAVPLIANNFSIAEK